VSVIVPCFNEAAVIRDTATRLTEALNALPDIAFETIYVDDGSRDATLAILRELQAHDERVRLVSLSRNFGHQVAVTAGLEHTRGDAVVVIDADLQDPPEVIREMVERWRDGADVAYGVRVEREGETAFKLWTAGAFYRAINRMSDVPIPLNAGDFRLMDRKVVDALLAMPERDRFIRGMVAWIGFRQDEVAYKRAARAAGTTKYPLAKMLRLATDGILSFSVLPLRLATWTGFAAAALSVVGIIYALVMRVLTDNWVPGWTLLFIGLLLIGGIQLVFLGLIGEYLGRVYGEVKRRPLYFVKERRGFAAQPTGGPSHGGDVRE
jgi:dolichol-phosphate mannosyltransferase